MSSIKKVADSVKLGKISKGGKRKGSEKGEDDAKLTVKRTYRPRKPQTVSSAPQIMKVENNFIETQMNSIAFAVKVENFSKFYNKTATCSTDVCEFFRKTINLQQDYAIRCDIEFDEVSPPLLSLVRIDEQWVVNGKFVMDDNVKEIVMTLFDFIVERGGLLLMNDRRYGIISQGFLHRSCLIPPLVDICFPLIKIDWDTPDPETGRTALMIAIQMCEWANSGQFLVTRFPNFDPENCDHQGRTALDYLNLFPPIKPTFICRDENQKDMLETVVHQQKILLHTMVKHLFRVVLPEYKIELAKNVRATISYMFPKELISLILIYLRINN
jgi:hypothetical protein